MKCYNKAIELSSAWLQGNSEHVNAGQFPPVSWSILQKTELLITIS